MTAIKVDSFNFYINNKVEYFKYFIMNKLQILFIKQYYDYSKTS